MITQTINLDVVPNGVPPIIHVSQYDTGERKLKFNIVSSAESADLSNATVTISGVKPDGHGFEYEATFSNNVVIASVTEQMTAVAGKVECALTFTTSNGVAQTARFDLEVKASPINNETIISDTEIPEIIALAREQEANAAQSASNAAASATAAATSASNAASSEANAATSESNAATSASNAATSEANAATSETNAATSEGNASDSATAAATSATNAANSANEAAGWCDNNGDSGQSSSSATNNAYYWAQFAQQYATGALIWMGDITFASIPTSGMSVGDMYNVTDEFTTDNRFNVGVGIVCPAGTNIIWGNANKWDIQAPPYKSSQISYSNATSGMSASNVQAAIDELSDEVAHAAKGVVGTEAEIAAKISRGEIERGTPIDITDDEEDDEITSLQVTHGNDTLKNVLDSIDADLAGKQSQTLSQQIAGQTTVEGCLTTLNANLSDKVSKAGDVMTGPLSFKRANPTMNFIDMNGSTERHKVFAGFANSGGDFYIYDNTQSKGILISKASGEVSVNGTLIPGNEILGSFFPSAVVSNCNTFAGIGKIAGNSTSNSPNTNFYGVLISIQNGNYRAQLAISINTTPANMYVRTQLDNGFTPWARITTS